MGVQVFEHPVLTSEQRNLMFVSPLQVVLAKDIENYLGVYHQSRLNGKARQGLDCMVSC